MASLMVEMICDGGSPDPAIEQAVARYIDQSTGILTIKQMRWLEEAVRRYGLSKTPRTASEYKRIYNERLLAPVYERLARLDGSQPARDSLMIVGARGPVARAGSGGRAALSCQWDRSGLCEARGPGAGRRSIFRRAHLRRRGRRRG